MNNRIVGTVTLKNQNELDSLTNYINLTLDHPIFSVAVSDEIFQSLDWSHDNEIEFYGDNIFLSKFKYIGEENIKISDHDRLKTTTFLWGSTKIWLDKETKISVKKKTIMPDSSIYFKVRLFEN